MKRSKKLCKILGMMACLFMAVSCSNTISVSSKKTFQSVNLPDGSLVLINRNSSIAYKEDFDVRIVQLEGEAFFDVVPGKERFIVTTDLGEIEVLGTEFNVKTTASQLEVDVKEGVVEVKTAYNKSKLKKGINAVYTKGEKTVQQIKSNQEFKKWTNELRHEFKKLGKDIKPVVKTIGNEFRDTGKEIKKEFKKLKKN
ncbi:FecR family protein [Aquimarina sp. SS2-1]|uniref:FecR family protein n=1 Tax=Aquimarina besae TaxID=3342247 RepID=UPI0036704E31